MSPTRGSAPRLLRSGEVAAMLYVHPRTVTRWANSGKLTSVLTPGGQRRFALTEVLQAMSGQDASRDVSSAYESLSGAVAHDSPTARAARSVNLRAAEAGAAGALVVVAATTARCDRQAAGREADALVANEAARHVVGARFRADAAAARVRGAAELAAEAARARATPGDLDAELLAAQTAWTVEAAAVLVAEEAATLAEVVADGVATTAALITAKRMVLELAIQAEADATAAALTTRTLRAASVSAEEARERVGGEVPQLPSTR